MTTPDPAPEAAWYTVRDATTDDLPRIRALLVMLDHAGQRHDPNTDVTWWNTPDALDHLRRRITADDAQLVVAEEVRTGEVIGVLEATLDRHPSLRTPAARLQRLYVLQRHRRCGIGRDLINRWTTWADETGSQQATLDVHIGNDNALRFYEGLGFRPLSVRLELVAP